MGCETKFIIVCLVLGLAVPVFSLVAGYLSSLVSISGIVIGGIIALVIGIALVFSTITQTGKLLSER